MRQLNPKVAEDRKRTVLRWVVHNYIKTSRPIASSIIAEEAGLELSSASIRGILKELEDEGYLHQPHTSAGRVPTDTGYRFYVDYLEDIQRLASTEKSRIEREVGTRLEELDNLLSQTSKLLSHISRKAGLVLSPRIESQKLRRLELIPLGGRRVLAIVVTDTGQVRHWPVELSFAPSVKRIQVLNRFLNEHAEGKSIGEIHDTLAGHVERADRELRDLQALSQELLGELGGAAPSEPLYLDNAASLMEGAQDFGSFEELQSMMRVLEERRALVELLQNEFGVELAAGQPSRPLVRVSIGAENRLPELKNLSLVTTAYRMGDKVVGVLGVLGTKRMEYARMIGLVEHISRVVSKALENWDGSRGDIESGGSERPG